ncbi:MAG: hypothetical protein LUI39_03345 [Lachnospiraceae bacterium]|nr:hypothetical protein [Lachnospiraceae bacterium]
MNMLKKYSIELQKNNEERVWREINYADETYPQKHPLERFIIAGTMSNYVAANTSELQIFRYRHMTRWYQMNLSRTTLNKRTKSTVKDSSGKIADILDAYDLNWCRSAAFQPQQYCNIRKVLADLLAGVGSSYWAYYREYLCARGYQYSTPMTELAYICADLSKELIAPLESMAKTTVRTGRSFSSDLDHLKRSLQALSKPLVRFDDYAVNNYLKQDFLEQMKQIHDRACGRLNLDCLYELDKLYSAMICTYVISNALDGKFDGIILNDKWRKSPERENTDTSLREMLSLSQECMSAALPVINQFMINTWI